MSSTITIHSLYISRVLRYSDSTSSHNVLTHTDEMSSCRLVVCLHFHILICILSCYCTNYHFWCLRTRTVTSLMVTCSTDAVDSDSCIVSSVFNVLSVASVAAGLPGVKEKIRRSLGATVVRYAWLPWPIFSTTTWLFFSMDSAITCCPWFPGVHTCTDVSSDERLIVDVVVPKTFEPCRGIRLDPKWHW